MSAPATAMTRQQWELRYAARVMQATGCDPAPAVMIAAEAADQYERDSLYVRECVSWSSGSDGPEYWADAHMDDWTDIERRA